MNVILHVQKMYGAAATCAIFLSVAIPVQCASRACVSADLDPSRFWIPYDVTHCLDMSSSLKCRKVTYKMCVAHPRLTLLRVS